MSIIRPVAKRFHLEELEPRLPPASDLFAVPAADTPGTPVELRFEWGAGGAAFKNEVGIYAIDDAAGRVNGLLPGDAGYIAQALARAQVVFASGAGIGAKSTLSVEGGQLLGLYLIANNTTDVARAGQATPFFSFDSANIDKIDHVQTRNRGDGGRDFRFEDMLGGGDLDYNDAVISVTRTYAISTPGQVGQTVQTTFAKVSQDAEYHNEVGLFRVDDRAGSIGNLKPGDPGYLRAALANGTRQVIFSDTNLPDINTRVLTLEGGVLYSFYIVTNGTAEELLALNEANTVSNGPLAYFSFSTANPDRMEHLDWHSVNQFGLEDLPGGGDQDFNDMVIQFGFGTPQGTPAPVPPTVPPPPPADTTPPASTFALTSDTGTSSTDRITNDQQITTTITDASTITRLRAGFDTPSPIGFTDLLPNLASDGRLTLTTALITQLNNGVPLTDGQHTLFVEVADAAGNSDLRQFSFTLDRTAPDEPLFDLAALSDTGATGDLRTEQDSVALSGTAEAGVTLELSRAPVPGEPGTGTVIATTTANSNGVFIFPSVALNVGPNSYVVRTVDVAGNIGGTLAQTFTRNTPPTVPNPIANQMLTVAGGPVMFDLANVFADAEQVVRLATSFPTGSTGNQTGNIDINLFANQTSITVDNFLDYVTSGLATQNYDGSIFHRLAPGFVLQGGGFKFNDVAKTFPEITEMNMIVNEPGISNTRGTIAMAKLPGDPNSATSEFFFNLDDNSATLDDQNGGFTVFGQILAGSQQTIDGISQMSTFSGQGIPGAAPFPIRPGANVTSFPTNITTTDLAVVTTARELTAAERLSFLVTVSPDSAVANAAIVGSTLTITPTGTGTTSLTVRATDLDGSTMTTVVNITVN